MQMDAEIECMDSSTKIHVVSDDDIVSTFLIFCAFQTITVPLETMGLSVAATRNIELIDLINFFVFDSDFHVSVRHSIIGTDCVDNRVFIFCCFLIVDSDRTFYNNTFIFQVIVIQKVMRIN
eukprot:TRINITY_DN6343_c0_g1_i1.p2 TRINITY_DN6343_c0_g1~~TRINITY_DN6343_c0_g1_i1.p2  ORF type:complete len:122 (-),score=7.66 TRINITY_DN6343_c0_g1_i1:1147-1512(-)